MGGEQHPVPGVPLPPDGVLGHHPVPVAHGRADLCRVLEVEGELGARLRDGAGVLEDPGAPVPVRSGPLPLQQREGRPHVGGHGPALGERPPHRALDGLPDPAGRPGRRVEPLELGEQPGMAGRHVGGDLVEQPRPRVGDVVAHELHRPVRVPDVVPPHPLQEVQVLAGVPDQVRLLELLAHDRAGIALAAQHVRVQPQPRAPVGLQGVRGEALVLDEVPEQPVLGGEELGRAVGRLADAHDGGRARHGGQWTQVGERLGVPGEGADRVVGLLRPRGRHQGDGGQCREEQHGVPEQGMPSEVSQPGAHGPHPPRAPGGGARVRPPGAGVGTTSPPPRAGRVSSAGTSCARRGTRPDRPPRPRRPRRCPRRRRSACAPRWCR